MYWLSAALILAFPCVRRAAQDVPDDLVPKHAPGIQLELVALSSELEGALALACDASGALIVAVPEPAGDAARIWLADQDGGALRSLGRVEGFLDLFADQRGLLVSSASGLDEWPSDSGAGFGKRRRIWSATEERPLGALARSFDGRIAFASSANDGSVRFLEPILGGSDAEDRASNETSTGASNDTAKGPSIDLSTGPRRRLVDAGVQGLGAYFALAFDPAGDLEAVVACGCPPPREAMMPRVSGAHGRAAVSDGLTSVLAFPGTFDHSGDLLIERLNGADPRSLAHEPSGAWPPPFTGMRVFCSQAPPRVHASISTRRGSSQHLLDSFGLMRAPFGAAVEFRSVAFDPSRARAFVLGSIGLREHAETRLWRLQPTGSTPSEEAVVERDSDSPGRTGPSSFERVEDWLAVLDAPDLATRMRAQHALASRGAEAPAWWHEALLAGPAGIGRASSDRARRHALWSAVEWARAQASSGARTQLVQLLDACLSSTVPEVRVQALRAFERVPEEPSPDALARALSSDVARVTCAAIELIGRRGVAGYDDAIANLRVGTSDEGVRVTSAWALERLGAERALLRRVALEVDSSARESVWNQIQARPTPAFVRALLGLIRDPETPYRPKREAVDLCGDWWSDLRWESASKSRREMDLSFWSGPSLYVASRSEGPVVRRETVGGSGCAILERLEATKAAVPAAFEEELLATLREATRDRAPAVREGAARWLELVEKQGPPYEVEVRKLLSCRPAEEAIEADAPSEEPAGSEPDANEQQATRPSGASDARAPLFARLDAARTGLDFENPLDWDHPLRHLYQHGWAGGGVAVGDADGDGFPELFLTSQTGANRLFANQRRLRFVDCTAEAGLEAPARWSAGAAFADVDGDGDQDLFVANYDTPNELWINRGNGRFDERAGEFGLDYVGASVQGAFADYDRDGDLDLFLLTNRLYPGGGTDRAEWVTDARGARKLAPGQEDRFALQRRLSANGLETFLIKAGERDRLYRNDGAAGFTEVGEAAGIFGHHPGLAALWVDFDHDGLVDLFVGNDFWDPDFLYRNQGDGRFLDVKHDALPHTSWFTMGVDAADLNRDGRIDLFAADMAPTTHFLSKLMMGEMGDSRWFLESASPRQYMRNALFLNTGTERFEEAAFLAGLASSDWSWSVLFGDLDLDGSEDLFVTNGTANHSFDPDLNARLRALAEDQDRRGLDDPAQRYAEAFGLYREVEPRPEVNLAFRNAGGLRFERVQAAWGLDERSLAFGAALADLDRDGDLDVVTQNLGAPVSLFENRSRASGRLLVSLHARGSAPDGFDAELRLDVDGERPQLRQMRGSRGYLSSGEPVVHFGGLPTGGRGARLEVRWPSGARQVIDPVPAEHWLVVHEPRAEGARASEANEVGSPRSPETAHDLGGERGDKNATEGPLGGEANSSASSSASSVARSGAERGRAESPAPWLRAAPDSLGLAIGGRPELVFDDYAAQPLLPARLSTPGSPIACADFDGDGDEDLFWGGASGQRALLFVREGSGAPTLERPFRVRTGTDAGPDPWGDDRASEDTAALWFDANGDGRLDLFVASGSVEAPLGDARYENRLYFQRPDGTFERALDALPAARENSSCACAADFDRDGDLDLFVGSRSIPGRYPLTPRSQLLRNDAGRFVDVTDELAPGLAEVGLVTAALWSDLDGDGWSDLAVACEWGPIALFRGGGGRLVESTDSAGLDTERGWWRALEAADLDGDGRLDLVGGNAGLNNKYAGKEPLQLYYGELEEGAGPNLVEAERGRAPSGEPVTWPTRGLSCSSAAMPSVRVRMPSFREFAAATLTEIYDPSDLAGALRLEATQLASGVFWNRGEPGHARFEFEPLPRRAQLAPVHGIAVGDWNGDGVLDLALAQNDFSREPETGHWDGGVGLVLAGTGRGRDERGPHGGGPDEGGAFDALVAAKSGFFTGGEMRGLIRMQLDGVGAPDLVMQRSGEPLGVWLSTAPVGLEVELVGPPGNPTAIGTRVRWQGEQQSLFEVRAGSSGGSRGSSRVTLGPPPASRRLEVRWADGAREVLEVEASCAYLRLVRHR